MPGDTYYSLYPAVRTGYRPAEQFDEDTEEIAATISNEIEVEVTGEEGGSESEDTSVPIHLYGPGDVTGLDTDRIVRREPEPDTYSYPTRQFPVVEFDRPDLPWVYSPERADTRGRTYPWLTLVVVADDHRQVGFEPLGGGQLPVLEAPPEELPDPSESWAWAHAQLVHSKEDEDLTTLGADDVDSLEDDEVIYDPPPMVLESVHSRSRLLCGRNLEADTHYRACLVPTFEPGRRAGLGQDPYPADDDEDEDRTIEFAWDGESNARLPVYDSWEFGTSEGGDFKSLAKALDPVEFGPEVGIRSVDVSAPGPSDLKLSASEGQTVGLEGALRSFAVESDGYAAEGKLESLLSRMVILEDELPEGIVGPPLYGRMDGHHGSIGRPWYGELNRDPRYRIHAGLGAEVVQRNQEELMTIAWEQFGDLREFNREQAIGELVRDSIAGEFEDITTQFEAIKGLEPERLFQFASIALDDAVVDTDLFDVPVGNVDRVTVETALALREKPTVPLDPEFQKLTTEHGPLGRHEKIDATRSMFGSLVVDDWATDALSTSWVSGEAGAWDIDPVDDGQQATDPTGGTGEGYGGGVDGDAAGGTGTVEPEFHDAIYDAEFEVDPTEDPEVMPDGL